MQDKVLFLPPTHQLLWRWTPVLGMIYALMDGLGLYLWNIHSEAGLACRENSRRI